MTPGNPPQIELGLEATCACAVSEEWTLAHIDPRLPAVFSTPALVGLMEMACSQAIRPALPEGTITVGVRVEVDHVKAVPAGVTVVAVSKLVEINGRRLIFDVEVRSAADVIGRGRIFHTIVDHARFLAIAAAKPASR